MLSPNTFELHPQNYILYCIERGCLVTVIIISSNIIIINFVNIVNTACLLEILKSSYQMVMVVQQGSVLIYHWRFLKLVSSQ